MTELQKREFELLKLTVELCEKLNLRYYLACGSALGAVKYKGFIPWDDDIDVALPRKDYEILLREGQKLLPEWAFLQNYRTDPEFPLLGTKLRDCRTTYIEAVHQNLNINHGVFIDIFPLDGYPETEKEQADFEQRKRMLERRRVVRLTYERFRIRWLFDPSQRGRIYIRTLLIYWAYRLFGCYRHTEKTLAEYEKLLTSYSTENSSIWCNHANSSGKEEYAPRSQYGDGIEADFEGLSVRIPTNYHEYLFQKYGDYTQELPPEEQVGHHDYTVRDLERPYTYYNKK